MRPPGLLDDAPVSGKQAAGRTVQSPRPGGLRCVTRVGLVPSLTEDTTNCPKTALVDQFFLTDRGLFSPQGNE